MVSLCLNNMSNKAIEIDYGFSVSHGNGKQVAYYRSDGPKHFGGVQSFKGWRNFAKHSTLLSSLVNGALVIDVHIRLAKPTKSVPPAFILENPLIDTVAGVFLDEKYSDIVFEIGGDQRKDNAMKVAKIARERFPAHRVIVAKCSSILADLCASHNDNTTPIQINDVTPDIFRCLLNYIYGGKVSDDDTKSHDREIIDAADKYGVVNLKLEAEASLVEATTFTIENVMELLIYAESKNCALLKEAAMDYIVDNKFEVLEKLSFADVPGTINERCIGSHSKGRDEERWR
jgi:hypothetical protein